MLYYQFEIIGKNLFGSSWKKQMADNLFIDHRRIQDWSKRGTDLPEFVEKEIKNIATRRLFEIEFTVSNIDSLDRHSYAILKGEIHHLDNERITKEDIEQFVESQKYEMLRSAWSFKQNGDSFDEIKDWCEWFVLGENDIAQWCEDNDCNVVGVDDVQEIRSENLFNVLSVIEKWFS